jgi:predicted nucleic acid-binding protein
MDMLHNLLDRQDLASKDITDAHLAALAIAHGWRLVTFDRGFGRFDGLAWLEP